MQDPVIAPTDERPYSADFKDFIDVPKGLRWECVRCGSCCGNVFSQTWLDIELTKYIGTPVDNYCKHLDRADDNRCTIHDRRPNTCRGFPFIIRKEGEHYKVQIYSKCPGVGKGNLVDFRERVKYLLKLALDEHNLDFIVDWEGEDENRVKLYRIK